jgi:hypothetical protein
MIFPLIESEPTVQEKDKTRLSAVKSFKSNDESAITLVEIEPEAGSGFINVTGSPINPKNWFLDWSYAAAGTKVATVRITTNGAPSTLSKSLVVVTEAVDKLWSDDSDLVSVEPDILGWVRPGRASFKDYHRLSQKRILEWLDNMKVWNKDGAAFTKDDIDLVIAAEDLKRISTYWSLELIFGGLSNKPDDTFAAKEKGYRASRKELQGDRSRIRADYNKDGTTQKNEQFQMRSSRLVR